MMKIGTVLTIFKKSWKKDFLPVLDIGFDYIELLPENEKVYTRKELSDYFKEQEIIIHSPFVEANLISNSNFMSSASVDYLTTILTPLVEDFNPKVITQHIGAYSFFSKDIDLKQFIDLTKQFPRLAVENMPNSDSIWRKSYPSSEEQLDFVLSKVKNSITFDVGHWLIQDYDVYKLVEKYANRIANIHIHDVVDGEDHKPLGTGVLDVEKFLNVLREVKYNNYLTVEVVSDVKDTISSFQILKRLINR